MLSRREEPKSSDLEYSPLGMEEVHREQWSWLAVSEEVAIEPAALCVTVRVGRPRAVFVLCPAALFPV